MFREWASGVFAVAVVASGCSAADPRPLGWSWRVGDTFVVEQTLAQPWHDLGPVTPAGDHGAVAEAWRFEVVDAGWIPEIEDPIRALTNTIIGLTPIAILRVFKEHPINTISIESDRDPVAYLIVQADRDRLIGVVEKVDGEVSAWVDDDPLVSWSALGVLPVTLAPVAMLPWGVDTVDRQWILEDGSEIATWVDADAWQVRWTVPVSGGEAVARWDEAVPWWQSFTDGNRIIERVEDQSTAPAQGVAQFSTAQAVAAIPLPSAGSPFRFLDRTPEPATRSVWAGAVWNLRDGSNVLGPIAGATWASRIEASLGEQRRDAEEAWLALASNSNSEASIEDWKRKVEVLSEAVNTAYASVARDLEDGTWLRVGGELRHADGSVLRVASLSAFDKLCYARWIAGAPQPFAACAWELTHHYHPNADSNSDHSAGWAAASVLRREPIAPVRTGFRGGSVEFSVADQKALLVESHEGMHGVAFGTRYAASGNDSFDLSPPMVHALLQEWTENRIANLILDVDSGPIVRQLPVAAVQLNLVETTAAPMTAINVNTATPAELVEFVGLSSGDADALALHRHRRGPVAFVSDLEGAVSAATLRKLDARAAATASAEERTFSATAVVSFASDLVHAGHVDADGAERVSRTYRYTLVTDRHGRWLRGAWDHPADHPDFAWVARYVPDAMAEQGWANPFVAWVDVAEQFGWE